MPIRLQSKFCSRVFHGFVLYNSTRTASNGEHSSIVLQAEVAAYLRVILSFSYIRFVVITNWVKNFVPRRSK